MCVHVSVNVFCRATKILKKSPIQNRTYRVFQSNGISPIFLLLDPHFQGQSFVIFIKFVNISHKWRQIEQALLQVMYFPSNGATANVVRHDIDLDFQDHKIS